MLKKIILCMLFSLPSFAQTAVKAGDIIPADGVYLTLQESAELIADKEFRERECKLELEYTKKEIETKHEGELKKLNATIEIMDEKNTIVLDLKQKQIDNLYKELEENSKDYSLWWMTGGIVAGATSAILIFFAATQTQKAPYLLSGG